MNTSIWYWSSLLVRIYARKLVFSLALQCHMLYTCTIVIIAPLDINWYQSVTHNSLLFYFRIASCTSIRSTYLLNCFRVMLLHALVRTRMEDLIHERFVCLGPTSDGVNSGQFIYLSVQGGSSLSTFWGGVNALAKPLITARRLLDQGHSSKGEKRATPQNTTTSRPRHTVNTAYTQT